MEDVLDSISEEEMNSMRQMAARLMGVDEEYLAAMEKLYRVCITQNTMMN